MVVTDGDDGGGVSGGDGKRGGRRVVCGVCIMKG